MNCRICGDILTTGVRFHFRMKHQLSIDAYLSRFPEDSVQVLQLYDTWRRNVSKANKGRTFTKEHCNNLSLAHIGKMTGMDNPSKRPEVGKKISMAKKGKPISLETRLRMRKAFISKKQNVRGRVSFRTDLGHICRSMWEANVARCLIYCDISYEYEPEVFVLDNHLYIPDFCLPTYDLWLEVKGNWFEGDREKIELFKKLNPDKKLIIIDENVYRLLIIVSKIDISTLEVDDIVRSLLKNREVSRDGSLLSFLVSLVG